MAIKRSVYFIWNANAHKEPKYAFQMYPKSLDFIVRLEYCQALF